MTSVGRVVGRTRERALLAASLDDALAARGSVVLLTGEGGMGKTTLADELIEIAKARGVIVARGHAWEGQGSPPLVVWREVFEALGEPVAGRLDAGRVRQLLAEASRRGPLLVVLEDLHASDADSARVVAQLSARLADMRVLVVATLREEELRERPGAAEALCAMSTTSRRIAVPPLTSDGVAELAADLIGHPASVQLVRTLVVRSDGNAFFVRELLDAARGVEVPPGIAAAVRQRVLALDSGVVELLRASACGGREIDLQMVAGAVGVEVPRALEVLGAAVAAGVLQDLGGGRLRFRHALVAEALVEGLLPAVRVALHLQLARAAQAAVAVHAVTVAHHLALAGPVADPADLVRWSTLAGEEAELAGAPLEAVRHLRRAAEAGAGGVAEARLQERIGHCLFSAGAKLAEAVRAFERALAGYETAGDRRRCGIVHSRLASHLSLYRHTSDFPRAARHFAAAEQLLPEPLDRAHMLVGRSTLALLGGHPREALADAEEALAAAESGGRPALASTARLMTGAGLLALGRLREGFAALNASFSTGAVVRPTVEVQTAWHGIVAGIALEDPALACSYAERADRALIGVDLPGQAQIVSDLLAPAFAIAGDVGRARDSLADEDLLGFQVEREGVVPAFAGHWTALRPVLEGMLHRDVASGHGVRVATLCWTLGWVLRQQGELAASREYLLLGLRDAERDGRVLDELRLRAELALGEVAAGRPAQAQEHADHCAALGVAEDLRGLGVRLQLVAAALRGAGFAPLLAEADRRGLPFLAVDVLARWAAAEPRRAPELRAQVAERLDRLGLLETGWAVLTAGAAPASAARTNEAVTVLAQRCVLRQEGSVWALETVAAAVRVPDGKGLRHLARLLSAPGREWHALDLAALAEGSSAASPAELDQPYLDAPTRAAYRAQLAELEQDLAEAEAVGDEAALSRAQEQRQALGEHLAAALGLGGRSRSWPGAAERARQSVTKTIRTAVQRIEQVDPLTAAHLRKSVRTGTFCSYAPDPSATVVWSVSGLEPARAVRRAGGVTPAPPAGYAPPGTGPAWPAEP